MYKQIEELSINAWPAEETKKYDGWIIHASDGSIRRSNSVKIMSDGTMPINEKIDFCENFYSKRNLPAIFKIIDHPNFTKIDSELDLRGYRKAAETSVQTKSISDNIPSDNDNVVIEYFPSGNWINEYCQSTEKTERAAKEYKKVILSIENQSVWAAFRRKGKAVGFGFAVTEGYYCGIYSLFVEKEHRDRGYAKAIMDKLIFEAKKLGADDSYLQVEIGNKPAEKIYGQLGYKELYRYWYRKKQV